MELTEKLLTELQKRLKIGNRRGVHLNAIPANSRYKFDLHRLSYINQNLPNDFIQNLLTKQPLKFKISFKDSDIDVDSLFEEDQIPFVKITKAFENLINQTEAIESEKGINTFGFGFPILIRRDRTDNKLTVAPILIWSLRIKSTREFNTWEINRKEDDPIYLNEILVNHLLSDSNIDIGQIPTEILDDGLISDRDLIDVCLKLLKAINTNVPDDLKLTYQDKLNNISAIRDKAYYEKILSSNNAHIDFAGLFSIFEVQKQSIIVDYDTLRGSKVPNIELNDFENHEFQPISSVKTDPSQQSILHSLESKRNILIQGPPGTGKSQTLTAILTNALENQKKTIVVCEKRTALEVLHNALIAKGLDANCILIRDIVIDRKEVVHSVRERVDRFINNYFTPSKESLTRLINRIQELIISINSKHQKIDKKILGDKNWTHIVGKLLSELQAVEDFEILNIRNNFTFTQEEFDNLLDLVRKGQDLYNTFKPIESITFIHPTKLIGDNQFLIENRIHESFGFYSKKIQIIRNLVDATQREYFE